MRQATVEPGIGYIDLRGFRRFALLGCTAWALSVEAVPASLAANNTDNVWSICPGLVKPQSRGYLRLNSADPRDVVEINANMLGDPRSLEALPRPVMKNTANPKITCPAEYPWHRLNCRIQPQLIPGQPSPKERRAPGAHRPAIGRLKSSSLMICQLEIAVSSISTTSAGRVTCLALTASQLFILAGDSSQIVVMGAGVVICKRSNWHHQRVQAEMKYLPPREKGEPPKPRKEK
jgi:hypothetical protein